MQPPFDIAADLDTPVSAWLKLAATPSFQPRYLLESVEGGERVGRWSFLGFGEATAMRLDGEGLRIGDVLHPTPADQAALLAHLRAALQAAPRPGPIPPGLPFQGGWVTAASYDLVRYFERLPSRARPRDLPTLVGVATRSVLVFDHATRRAAVLHDGPEDERLALRAAVLAALRGPLPPSHAEGAALEEPTPTLDEAAFFAAVHRVQEAIRAGDVYQLVPSIGFEGATALPPFEVYRALRLLNPSPYMFYADFGDVQLVGSSPEALVRLAGRRATLRPIAGTRPRGRTPEEDVAMERELLADPKEASEHVMLVDLARNDLGRVAVGGSVRVEPYRVIERYSHVMHIVSGVTGELDPRYDAFDLFAASFPAGTVVGAPKVRAMEIIDELEPVRRGFYAGTVGYFGHGGAMDQAIAIRTLTFHGGRYQIQAGAGVVADSTPEGEHAEIRAKAQALFAALRLARQGL
jgi:anthranilate synthase component 1